jgi:AraC family transcriptional regulator of adaptative response/methylated-DNA-[protein]-cysteine methyltransferase
MLQAFAKKSAAYDGVFFVAVKTTGIFCRPSCPSRPSPVNMEFFGSIRDCLAAGYRACKRCDPTRVNGTPPTWVQTLIARVDASADGKLQPADFNALGVTPERARRWFQQNYGMSFAAWCRNRRLGDAFARLRNGGDIDDAVFASGFESHSGFRDAFNRVFGDTPGRARDAQTILTTIIETPLGPMLAAANDAGLCVLEFVDCRVLEENFEAMRRRFDAAIVPGNHPVLNQLRGELKEYFGGKRKEFTVPLAARGTVFQEKVWRALQAIPFGSTIAYEELARRIGKPTAQRAVASANGSNRICILIPCHRVIGKDGTLTGYSAGVWRKRLLLELEKNG